MGDLCKAALFYLKDVGLSIIPVKIYWSESEKKWLKTPSIKTWKDYQSRKPTEIEVLFWFRDPANQVAIVTGEINGIYVFDLDFQKMSQEQRTKAEELLPDTFETLTATTPSGGQHIYLRKPPSMNGKPIPGFSGGAVGAHGFPAWVDLRGDGNMIIAPPSVRPDGKRYSFLNGQEVQRGSWKLIKEFPISINNIINIYIEKKERVREGRELPNKTIIDSLTICLQDGRRNESLNKILFHAYRGGLGFKDGTYLANFIGENTKDSEGKNTLIMDPKTIDATNQSAWNGARVGNFAEIVREWVTLQNGWFNLTDFRIYYGNTYFSLTREQMNNLYVIMNRLSDHKLIEKHPSKSGWYRKRDKTIVGIDLEEEMGQGWDILFPLGIDRLVNIYPKQIIILYSGPDGGKSAFLLDLMARNLKRFSGRINYFSSEMGSQELAGRVKPLGIPIKDWKQSVKMWERSVNFADVVNPEEINIVDFLAVHEDFSLVAKYIDDIWRALSTGVAFVVLQSKYNSELPRGGEFALEKARLAFSLLQKDRHHLCKIKKAKNWKNNELNPNGKVKKFTILHGCQINEKSDWMNEDEYETIQNERGIL